MTNDTYLFLREQDGFMMQFSREGFWGRGIYFALNSSYSHHYSYNPTHTSRMGTAAALDGEHEIFLAALLCGSEVEMNRDESQAKKDECRYGLTGVQL